MIGLAPPGHVRPWQLNAIGTTLRTVPARVVDPSPKGMPHDN